MKIPKTLKIGGIEYQVKFVDHPTEMCAQTGGCIIYDKQEIRIRKGMGPEYTESIFIHELLHAVLDSCCISMKEEHVRTASNTLHQVLKDNELF